MRDSQLTVRVAGRADGAVDVVLLELEAVEGALPAWRAGDHVAIEMPDGDHREYSLTGDPARGRWSLGVLVEREGRGGSRWIESAAVPGAVLKVSEPRSHFHFEPEGTRILLLAGGIGVTPLIPMAWEAGGRGLDVEAHYVGRSLSHMALRDELAASGADVHLHPRDLGPRPDVAALVAGGGFSDVYVCGPDSLIDAAEDAVRGRAACTVHSERFVPRVITGDRGLDVFHVRFDYSDKDGVVTAGSSILDLAENLGIDVPTSCREGTCGTCETPLLAGEVVHLDSVLSEQERQVSATLMICCSRATTTHLVVDL